MSNCTPHSHAKYVTSISCSHAFTFLTTNWCTWFLFIIHPWAREARLNHPWKEFLSGLHLLSAAICVCSACSRTPKRLYLPIVVVLACWFHLSSPCFHIYWSEGKTRLVPLTCELSRSPAIIYAYTNHFSIRTFVETTIVFLWDSDRGLSEFRMLLTK